MISGLAVVVCTAFVVIGLWHVYGAFAKKTSGESGAVPSVDGKPLFVPSTKATLAVAFVLFLFAALVAATGGMLSLGLPKVFLNLSSYGLAAGLLARAIGDFKYVGFFKKIRDSRFAFMDTFVYSPLCLLLSVGVAIIALLSAG